jgi:hypothetical protein
MRVESPPDGCQALVDRERVRTARRTALVLLLGTLAACAGADDDARWTVAEAETIRAVRGTPVNGPLCHGIGPDADEGFERFRCVAGARRPGESIDTVAVFYELVPEAAYSGPESAHRVERVSFVGGPGIP